MAIRAHFYKHTLNFSFDAGTSRGVLRKKDSYYIKVWDAQTPEVFGLGEAGPLSGLSPDYGVLAEEKLKGICEAINQGKWSMKEAFPACVLSSFSTGSEKGSLNAFPSVWFALETAFADLQNGGIRKIFTNDFFTENSPVPINGLIWMGDKSFMKKQIVEKINAGFTTIKLKIGAIDFEEELELLKFIRMEFSAKNLVLRVDANGAFTPSDAAEKLKRLSEYDLHSIEQPIAVDQEETLAALCESTPVPIALDEELIGNPHRKEALLSDIKPQYIILKPSLMGGISGSREWIHAAEKTGTGWWITSALESNIGLNAICQFTAEFDNALPQGLGTGKLYTNNFTSPLEIHRGKIFYDPAGHWDLAYFN